MGGVAAGEVGAQQVALDRLGQDDGGLALVLGGRLIGCVHLVIVVAAALEGPDLLIRPVLHQLGRAWITAEEVLAHVGAVVGLEGLVVAVECLHHQVLQGVVLVRREQPVPAAPPDHLDDVPARTLEAGLQLLNDLAVAAHRTVQPLEVAVDHEGEVVQLLGGGQLQHAAGLGLVHFAVAQEGPGVLGGGVLNAGALQVAVEPGLVDGLRRPQPHGDGGVLPEVLHAPRVRVGGQAPPAGRPGDLLPEPVQVCLGQPALQEGAGVVAGGGMPLEEDVVAATGVVLAAEEVVEADLIEGGGGGVGGDVAANADAGPLRPGDHHGRVPA